LSVTVPMDDDDAEDDRLSSPDFQWLTTEARPSIQIQAKLAVGIGANDHGFCKVWNFQNPDRKRVYEFVSSAAYRALFLEKASLLVMT